MLLLHGVDRDWHVAVGAPRPDWGAFWTAGPYALAPAGAPGEAGFGAGVPPPAFEALRTVLARLPALEPGAETPLSAALALVSAAFAETPTAASTAPSPRCRGRWRREELVAIQVEVPLDATGPPLLFRIDLGQGDDRDARLRFEARTLPISAEPAFRLLLTHLSRFGSAWQEVVDGPLRTHAEAMLKAGSPSMSASEHAFVGGLGDSLVVRLSESGQVRGCTLQPVDTALKPGFLCRGLGLLPHRDLWRTPADARRLQAMGRASAARQAEGAWPDLQPPDLQGFLGDLWRRLGSSVMPSPTQSTLLRGGRPTSRGVGRSRDKPKPRA